MANELIKTGEVFSTNDEGNLVICESWVDSNGVVTTTQVVVTL